MKHWSPRVWIWIFLGLGLCARVGSGISNLGFLAYDEYMHGSALVIPAQLKTSHQTLVDAAAFRTPVPSLVWQGIAQLSLRLGFESPTAQYRFHYVALGLWSLGSVIAATLLFLWLGELRLAAVACFLVSLHFFMPFTGSRTLVEGMAAPLLTLSIALLVRFWNAPRGSRVGLWSVVGATLALAAACQFRFHAGVCAVVFLLVLVLRGTWRDWMGAGLAGALGFVAIGLLDLKLRGRFHASLLEYLAYHRRLVAIQSEGTVFTHVGFLLGLTLPPAFFARYRGLNWRGAYTPLMPALLSLFVFVLAHTLIAIRHERFMLPMAPTFLVLLAPLALYLWDSPRMAWRRGYFLGLNALLLVLVSFPTNQNNVIGLAQWVDRNPAVSRVWAADDSVEIWPSAFIQRGELPLERVGLAEISARVSALPADCTTVLAVREDRLPALLPLLGRLREWAVFRPSLTEALVIRTNPHRNVRRAAVHVFGGANCSYEL